jgi:midasin (ATPase involved in ribosome maturation)
MVEVLQKAGELFADGGNGHDLCLLVTDGRFDKEAVRRSVQEMMGRGLMVVLVIIDSTSASSSVYDLRSVVRGTDGKMAMIPFLKDFPFIHYSVIDNVAHLPDVLSDLVKQWFESSTSSK